MSATSAQPLPAKLQSEFRTLVKLYEQKTYKKALKVADGILKGYPDHGETMSMRGLMLYHLDRKSEGFESAKKGLKANLSSHVCWHVLGLLHRFEKAYGEAVKALKTALRFDAENQVVLKDLANLLVYLRDFPAFTDVRRRILASRPQYKAHWFGLALAETLNGNFEAALTVLGDMEDAFPKESHGAGPEGKFETSENLCMRLHLLEQLGRREQALRLAEQRASEILDKVYMLESQAALGAAIGNFATAEKALRSLIARNPDNERYVFALLFVASDASSAGGSKADSKAPLDLRRLLEGEDLNEWKFEKFSASAPTVALEESEISEFVGDAKALEILETLPTGDGVEQTRLLIAGSGGNFRSTIYQYLRRKAVKGVPNLWRLLSGVWRYRRSEISEILMEVISDLQTQEAEKTPYVFPVLKLLETAFERAIGNLPAARRAAQEAVTHTPTFVEGILWRAKLAETAEERVEFCETARQLDLADRSLNSKTVKALLRAGEVERASELVLQFSKETSESKTPNLVEMQCAWWSLEMGDAHFRLGKHAEAEKHWKAVVGHFEEFKEDEFDFAAFCLRKGTVRPFLEFLRTQDKLKTHKHYRQATRRLAQLEHQLDQQPPAAL